MRINKGLDVKLTGLPQKVIEKTANKITEVAILGTDYIGLKPKFNVSEGDKVKLGDVLFYDKKNEVLLFTSPCGGIVKSINRGQKRVFESIVISVDDKEEKKLFDQTNNIESLSREKIKENLVNSGLWTAFRARPFSKIPNPQTIPFAIFVNAMDSNPIAPDVSLIINESKEDFLNGLKIISKLTEGKVFVCYKTGDEIPKIDDSKFVYKDFEGKHPSGLVGTHIHFISPVNEKKCVWHISAQDVIAFSRLFLTGELPVERIVAIGGEGLKNPSHVKTRVGAKIFDLFAEETKDSELQIISGSVLSGHEEGFLGRYHQQISVIKKQQKEQITTMLPIGWFEEVMPLDILPMQLLRALAIMDTDSAINLGCLELDEEDLALCSYVCPSKIDYGSLLRMALEKIEKEG